MTLKREEILLRDYLEIFIDLVIHSRITKRIHKEIHSFSKFQKVCKKIKSPEFSYFKTARFLIKCYFTRGMDFLTLPQCWLTF